MTFVYCPPKALPRLGNLQKVEIEMTLRLSYGLLNCQLGGRKEGKFIYCKPPGPVWTLWSSSGSTCAVYHHHVTGEKAIVTVRGHKKLCRYLNPGVMILKADFFSLPLNCVPVSYSSGFMYVVCLECHWPLTTSSLRIQFWTQIALFQEAFSPLRGLRQVF